MFNKAFWLPRKTQQFAWKYFEISTTVERRTHTLNQGWATLTTKRAIYFWPHHQRATARALVVQWLECRTYPSLAERSHRVRSQPLWPRVFSLCHPHLNKGIQWPKKMSLRRDYNHAPGIHLIIIEKYVYFEVNRPNTKLCNICNHNIQCQIILYSLLHKQHNSGVITFILEHYFQKQRDMPTKRLSIRKTSAQNYCCRNKNESLGEPTVASSIDEQYTVCHYEKSLLT